MDTQCNKAISILSLTSFIVLIDFSHSCKVEPPFEIIIGLFNSARILSIGRCVISPEATCKLGNLTFSNSSIFLKSKTLENSSMPSLFAYSNKIFTSENSKLTFSKVDKYLLVFDKKNLEKNTVI